MGSNFSKVATEVDFSAFERSILDFWQRTNAFERRREKNRGKPTWSFLDGPITANNPMGVHHAGDGRIRTYTTDTLPWPGMSCAIKTASTAKGSGWKSRWKKSLV